jgi:hydrogenase-4 component B
VTTGQLLLLAAALQFAAMAGARAWPRFWIAATLGAATAMAIAAGQVLFDGAPLDWHSPFDLGGLPLHLRLDAISALFLLLVAIVGGSGAVYAHGYWNDREHPASAPRGRRWWSAMVLCMGLVLLSSTGLHFLIAWELFAICGYFLITLEPEPREVRAAGWLYLAASHAGTLALFAFFTLLAVRTGSWELGPMQAHPELAPLFWIALFGFGVKAGLFPLHIWLPSAHANAPSHVSALMSGVAIKMGIYGIIRFGGWLPVPPAAGWVVISLGSVTALFGIAFAFGQTDLKRLLAYSSVENIGIMLVGLGGAFLGITHADAAWGRLALAGALFHVVNHALFKSLLFFGAGSVLHATGTREVSRLGGLWRAMPWTATLFLVGAVAVAALPPLNGFVSEWLVYLGLFGAVTSRSDAAWIAMPAAIMLGVTGALALASFTKAAGMIFLGAARTDSARHAHEANAWMRVPMVATAVLCAGAGLAPLALWPAVTRAIGTWHAAWSAEPAPSPLVALGPVQIAVAIVALLGAASLWRVAARRGITRTGTWDCGYAAPGARMQYTGGSFSGIATRWFAWILRPMRRLRRPRGFFPREADWMERIPETVLERLLEPAARGFLWVAGLARRLQHGRLQYYIAYVAVGLAGLTALVATAKR